MQASTELRDIMLDIYRAWEKGDTSFIEHRMTSQPGGLAIGTDAREWWAGYDTIVQSFRSQEHVFEGSSVEADPQTYVHGDTGWLADQMIITLQDGTAIPARITAVFLKEDGDWKIVQWHASIGIPNEEAGFGDI